MPEVIHGIVRGPDGRPVEEARVCFISGPVPLPDVAALTAVDGTFQLTAPVPGRYSILCALADGRNESRSVDVVPEATTAVTFDITTD